MSTARYRVRFKPHVGAYEREIVVSFLLSRHAGSLIECDAGSEYELDLRKPARVSRFEIALNSWKYKGVLAWERLKDHSRHPGDGGSRF
jgi:hypothetical protein